MTVVQLFVAQPGLRLPVNINPSAFFPFNTNLRKPDFSLYLLIKNAPLPSIICLIFYYHIMDIVQCQTNL